LRLALASADNSNDAKMAMMAMTDRKFDSAWSSEGARVSGVELTQRRIVVRRLSVSHVAGENRLWTSQSQSQTIYRDNQEADGNYGVHRSIACISTRLEARDFARAFMANERQDRLVLRQLALPTRSR